MELQRQLSNQLLKQWQYGTLSSSTKQQTKATVLPSIGFYFENRHAVDTKTWLHMFRQISHLKTDTKKIFRLHKELTVFHTQSKNKEYLN